MVSTNSLGMETFESSTVGGVKSQVDSWISKNPNKYVNFVNLTSHSGNVVMTVMYSEYPFVPVPVDYTEPVFLGAGRTLSCGTSGGKTLEYTTTGAGLQ